ncbi:Undecaprenyl pyrophosphate synthetase [Pelagirhabdus alkalitolerans]|uniref:Isoprenyl transferase n=1 Tax=Pelagirhabdus alkalitolerans TaxID=1612202 RepID=A0A1G6H3W7_9BACI|nr:isoprenyl transferase [Pelagirhabdus alkalitolerans]SDB88980.1 Undecaprenyl pyrophosphate synthetase [Pelagirhabdus alkalitolerans]
MAFIKWPFQKYNKKDKENHEALSVIPKHVAIIMDGNGRWANKRNLPRFAGHKEGMDNVKRIVKAANAHQIEVLTLYAFSTENWKRPRKEIEYILKLPKEFLKTYLPELIEQNVRIQTIGHFDQLPDYTKEAVGDAIEQTKANTGLILNIALNYGSRAEMVDVVKSIAKEAQTKDFNIDDVNEQFINNYLYTSQLPEPDLLIRTSGEQRLSNFLLWQLAYTEFWFTDIHWPAFTESEFEEALMAYQARKRRYGGLS